MSRVFKSVLAVSTALLGATMPGCDCNQTGHPKCGNTKYHVSCLLFDSSDPQNKQIDDADEEYKFENGQEVTLCKNIKWPGKPTESTFQSEKITITCKDGKFTLTNPFQKTVSNKSAEMKVSKPERYRGTSRDARLWGAVTTCPSTHKRVYLWVAIHNLNQSDWTNSKGSSSFVQSRIRRLRKDISAAIGGF